MIRRILPVLLLCSAQLFADGAVAVKQVRYKSGNETVSGVLYAPTEKLIASQNGRYPALVVIHEWWGLDNWVKEQAEKLATQGYVALAVDLYRGKSTTDPEVAHELMRGLPEDRGMRDLHAAVAYLKTLKNVDPNRIGSIGWCMGGGWSLALAENEPTLKAAVVNYGQLSSDAVTLQPIHAAILGLFGAQDQGIPPESVHQFDQQMKSLGKTVEIKIYPDAGHGFQNPINKDRYRPEDTKDAWQRIDAFFQANLKK
jgi:carboxymethylenebutenolidase